MPLEGLLAPVFWTKNNHRLVKLSHFSDCQIIESLILVWMNNAFMSYTNLPESAREHKALWILDLVLSPNPPPPLSYSLVWQRAFAQLGWNMYEAGLTRQMTDRHMAQNNGCMDRWISVCQRCRNKWQLLSQGAGRAEWWFSLGHGGCLWQAVCRLGNSGWDGLRRSRGQAWQIK